ncbi:cytochrome oxidase putative small subunit CydP [Rhodoferax sp.]|uniref:cytochrome oxidase putative small subunit CydP n=1 Tax=Rhodoferax sp. TaxID=50421 RepID=UPI0025CF18C3|nr:cytochrome oxidase putative small subunit CydP [Rhodoferax sp.]
MNLLDKKLLRKLTIVLLVKLAVLVALWWFFVRDQRVTVDGNSVASQFLAPAPAGAKGTRP